MVLRRVVLNYVARHRNRVNQLLHLAGIPLSFGVSIALLVECEWIWATAAFVGGYVLQFFGHAIEGNDSGELILVKKLLGRPYVEFGPVSEQSSQSD